MKLIDQVLNNMIGFDRLVNHNYPPYNLVKDENGVVLEIACSGFKKSDLKVYLEGHTLIVEGHKPGPEHEPDYIYRGLAHRSWRHQFHLQTNHQVQEVVHEDGVLKVRINQHPKTTRSTLEIN
jgi:HSP20 family molecular chaperone IbpA